MDKVIQIANLLPSGSKHNSLPGRVYSAMGLCPTLRTPTGGAMSTDVSNNMQKVAPLLKLRYVLGRTNAKGKGENHTLKFHANPYFGCVTANRFTNRETWIAEIK